jgi:hypothetical protein
VAKPQCISSAFSMSIGFRRSSPLPVLVRRQVPDDELNCTCSFGSPPSPQMSERDPSTFPAASARLELVIARYGMAPKCVS